MKKAKKALAARAEIDADIEGLGLCLRGMDMTSERMRSATLEFLIDKYIQQPIRDRRKEMERRIAERDAARAKAPQAPLGRRQGAPGRRPLDEKKEE